MLLFWLLMPSIVIILSFYLSGKWLRRRWKPDGKLPYILPAIAIFSLSAIPAMVFIDSRFKICSQFDSSGVYSVLLPWFICVLTGIISSFWGLVLGLGSLHKNIKKIRLWICVLGCGFALPLTVYIFFGLTRAP
jgi:hypothetical protein